MTHREAAEPDAAGLGGVPECESKEIALDGPTNWGTGQVASVVGEFPALGIQCCTVDAGAALGDVFKPGFLRGQDRKPLFLCLLHTPVICHIKSPPSPVPVSSPVTSIPTKQKKIQPVFSTPLLPTSCWDSVSLLRENVGIVWFFFLI